jgi:cellulose synthase/poly-beta-1,6-N-acetylglucosamine synthase-like glycosyltransferase
MEFLSPPMRVLFWLSLGMVAYAYVGYPILLYALARCFGRLKEPPAVADQDLPAVSLLIAAYNEEAEIEKRIQTATMMDYPPDRLEVVIASDGSSDATPALVRAYTQKGIRLLDYPQRRGKSSVLNDSVPAMKGSIVLLSDANTQIDPQALRRIVRWFAHPAVGVVCGRLHLRDPETGRNVDSLYWKYETFLKKQEARLGALLGANGAIYAMRKELFTPIPPDTIVDDFVIPLRARLQTGCKLVYEKDAVAVEETPCGIGSEFHRRSRIGAGGFQSIGILWRLLHPRHGWTAFAFFSHKILRWLCPFFLVALVVSNILLLDDEFYRQALTAQAAFYLLSLVSPLLPVRFKVLKPLRLTAMFTGMNAALMVGFWRWLRGTQKGAWRRTARLAEADGVR